MSTSNQKYKIFMKSSLFIGGRGRRSMRKGVQVTNSAQTGADVSIFGQEISPAL